ncbi:unnamed protein product [Discosporangium mesarthrocarpum]
MLPRVLSSSLPRQWSGLTTACKRPLPCSVLHVLRMNMGAMTRLSSGLAGMEEKGGEGTDSGSGSPAFVSPQTTVRHPPAPGWNFPPVPAGCEAKFAVIRLGNTQYKVTKDDVIVAEKVVGAAIGTTLDIRDVLLVGTRQETIIGRPVVGGASVKLLVEEQTKDAKVIVFKKRRRKSSQRTKGHRREVTLLRVTEITH